MTEGIAYRLREALRGFRRRRKGIPTLAGVTHQSLRGRHEGESVLVLGNGPSAKPGLDAARNRFGPKLSIIGMNGCGLLCAPTYYVFSDAFALMLFGHLIDPLRSTAILQPSALGRLTHDQRREHPELVDRLRALASSPSTICLDRDKRRYTTRLDLKLAQLAGPGSGPAALQLAMLMLLPGLDVSGEFTHPPRPGRLIVAGMDGYEPDKQWHFYSGGNHAGAAFEAQSRADPQKVRDALAHNLFQSAIMLQVMELARLYGIEVINLSKRGVLKVNDFCRDPEFDGLQSNRDSAKTAPGATPSDVSA